MYDEAICEGIPLLIGDKEHDKAQLVRSANYYESIGNNEEAERIRELIRYKY